MRVISQLPLKSRNDVTAFVKSESERSLTMSYQSMNNHEAWSSDPEMRGRRPSARPRSISQRDHAKLMGELRDALTELTDG
jgi:hypothetical protein